MTVYNRKFDRTESKHYTRIWYRLLGSRMGYDWLHHNFPKFFTFKKGKSLSIILCSRQTSRGFQNKTSLEFLRIKGKIKRKEHILCTEAFQIPSSAF